MQKEFVFFLFLYSVEREREPSFFGSRDASLRSVSQGTDSQSAPRENWIWTNHFAPIERKKSNAVEKNVGKLSWMIKRMMTRRRKHVKIETTKTIKTEPGVKR